MRFAIPILFLFLSSIESVATPLKSELYSFSKLEDIVVTSSDTFHIVQRYDDGHGQVVFYRALKSRITIKVHTSHAGKVDIQVNENGQNRYFVESGTGDLQEKYFGEIVEEFEDKQHDDIDDSHSHNMPSLLFHQPIKSQTDSATKPASQTIPQDNIVYTSFVVTPESLATIVSTSVTDEITVDEMFSRVIDYTNLVLVNSEIYDFRFALGKVIVLPDVADFVDLQVLAGDPPYAVNQAIQEGLAERMVYVFPSSYPVRFAGLARLWPFNEDNYNQGSFLSEASRHLFIGDNHVNNSIVLAHELGHSMGLQHQREANFATYDYAIPYGYTTEVDDYRLTTVMNDTISQFDSFSNPDLTLLEQPLGVPATEINAADASTFLRNTWPLTTTAVNLTGLNFNYNTVSNLLELSWEAQTDYSTQKLYRMPANYCSDMQLSDITETIDVSASQNTQTFPLSTTDSCFVLVGYYDNNGASLPRVLAMRRSGNSSSQYHLKSTQQTYTARTGNAVTIELSHQKLPGSSQFFFAFEDIETLDNGIQNSFLEHTDSRFSEAFDITVESFDSSSNIVLNFSDDPKLLASLLSSATSHQALTGSVQMRIRLCATNESCSESDNFLSESYVTLDVSELLPELPEISLAETATVFGEDETTKTISGHVKNVSEPEDIQISVNSESVSGWEILDTELVRNDDINGYTFNIEVPRPNTWVFDNHSIDINLRDTDVAVAVPVYWGAVPTATVKTLQEISVIDNEFFKITGEIKNVWQQISDLSLSIPANDPNFDGQALPMARTWQQAADGNVTFDYTFQAVREGRVKYSLRWFIEETRQSKVLATFIINVLADSDNDGMADEWEEQYGLDPTVDDSSLDSDNDGVSNLEEYQNRTSPLEMDTDNDGVADGDDDYPNDPERSEIEPEVPSSEIGRLAWRQDSISTATAQLVAGTDQVYLLTSSRELSAYDTSGGFLWSYRTDSDFPRISVIDDTIYLTGDSSSVEVVSSEGEQIWYNEYSEGWFYSGQIPVRSNGNILVAGAREEDSHSLIGLDMQGQLQWRLETEEPVVAAAVSGQYFYLVLDNAKAMKVDENGEIVWEYTFADEGAFAGRGVAIDSMGNFYFTATTGLTELLSLNADGELRWQTSICCTVNHIVIDGNGLLRISIGEVVDSNTGEVITRDLSAAGSVKGLVLDEQNALIRATDNGYVIASLSEATELADTAWSYNTKRINDERSVFSTLGEISSPLVLLDRKVIFITSGGDLIALNHDQNIAAGTWARNGGDNGNSGQLQQATAITPEPARVLYDFDGDGKSDVAVRRASNATQYVKNSGDEEIQRIVFGRNSADIPVSGDFDGDGITDIGIRRPSNRFWYIKNSSGVDSITNNADGITRIRFGNHQDDIPVPADFDGDGKTDIAVRRPSNQFWYVRNSSGVDAITDNADGITRLRFGTNSGDIPVVADYDGDSKADFAVRRPSNFHWYIRNSSGTDSISNNEDGITRRIFGRNETDIPVPADYDGDGKADLAVRRPSNQTWYILNSSGSNYNSTREDGIQRIQFGLQPSDIPIVADYDGDGKADIAVRRASNQYQYILNSQDGTIQRVRFGKQELDIPLAAPILTKMSMAKTNETAN